MKSTVPVTGTSTWVSIRERLLSLDLDAFARDINVERAMGSYDIHIKLLDFAQQLTALKTIALPRGEERDRLAMYLEKIAAVVESIRESFEEGKAPGSRCDELAEYVRTLAQVLVHEVPGEADRFVHYLSGAVLARGVLFIVADAGSREVAFSYLNQAAGRFRALANRLRLKPSDAKPGRAEEQLQAISKYSTSQQGDQLRG